MTDGPTSVLPDKGTADVWSLMLDQPSSPGWRQTASLDAYRVDHTATLLEEGIVLVVGGYSPATTLYNDDTGQWKQAPPSRFTHRGHSATRLKDGRVLIAGGGEDETGINTELYDPEQNAWVKAGALQTTRYHHTATRLPDGKVLVTGGTDSEHGGTPLTSAELYDPTTDTWSEVGPLAEGRVHHSATLLPDGRVLVVGGQGADDQSLATAEIFAAEAGTFTSAGTLGDKRRFHSATTLPDGRVLITGGEESLDFAAAPSELYDPGTGTWSATGAPAQPRRYHSATTLADGTVLVAGGYHESAGVLSHAEVYDPATGTWGQTPTMSTDRYRHTATLLPSGAVLVVGGVSNHDAKAAELYATSAPPATPPEPCETGNTCSTGLLNAKTGACEAQDRPANTDCGNQNVCDGQGTCVPTVHTTVVTCGSGALTGDQLCQKLGFGGAVSANGYWWGQCAGAGLCPGGWQGAEGLSCASWSQGVDCNGESFSGIQAAPWGQVRERLGDGTTRFGADEFLSCGDSNPGWTVRVRCHY
ncbi:Kelch repeat-containing protein [Melittangium boletus]|uniref:Kelch repeat-containing protein n=1 Tax=Melittangium boletus TaxID=83453 RepID=UPI003DA2D112